MTERATDSRSAILERIRDRLGRNAGNRGGAEDRRDAWLAARTPGPLPSQDDDPLARFCAKSEKMSSSVERVATLAEAPAAAARYLAGRGLDACAVVWPQLSSLDWPGAGLAIEARGAVDSDLVGITGCFCAVAETGSLMLCSGPDTPATVSLLPETHIAVVLRPRIVATMEQAWNLARSELGVLPRAVNFISGPSRTGDIEQTIVLGAHGPYRVHIVIVG